MDGQNEVNEQSKINEYNKKETRVFVIILVFSLCILSIIAVFFFAGKHVPNDVDPAYYDLGIKVIEITDKYLDYDITANEATIKLYDLYKRIGCLENHDDTSDIYYYSSSLIKAYINNIIFYIERDWSYTYTLDKRNDLSDILGESKR